MPEKEPQFFRPEIKEQEFQEETELERKRRLGKESEWDIAAPLFNEIKEAGVLSYAEHTTEKVDQEKGVDFIWGLEDKSHLAIQFSTSESHKTWEEKIGKIIGEIRGKPFEELKDVHPKPELLSRRERIERVPTIPLRIDWETIDGAYKRFEKSGKGGAPFDFLPEKREIEKELLLQALEGLYHLSSDKKLAQRFPELSPLARQRYETLNESVSKLLKKEKIA